MFVPQTPIIEIFIRGSLTYLSLFILLRFVLKRQSGGFSTTDLLLVVLIADAAQNAMANDYRSITEGVLLVVTIIFWSYALDWLGYRFRPLQRLIHPTHLQLVKDGHILWSNMERELITEGELMTQLRERGIDDVAKVKEAYMEADGQISAITYEGDTNDKPERKKQ
jgi:uncharacterized membrane protein YcaP (DUF421 family)